METIVKMTRLSFTCPHCGQTVIASAWGDNVKGRCLVTGKYVNVNVSKEKKNG
jgi:predicted RNA-binding Zn-ribbon protein involved in translation (DUF1610 family)